MKEKTRNFLFWFVLIQPFLDFNFFYHKPLSTVLPFTIPTILRIIGVLIILLAFMANKDAWRRFSKQYWLIAYLVILIVYCILHLWHMQNFNSINPSNYNYSTFGEVFYLFRMVLPLMLIYFTNYLDMPKRQFGIAMEGMSGIFSGVIVITNLFAISLKSYEHGVISGNIFTWFMGKGFTPLYGYSHSASKGYFYFTNTTSAILLMLAPLVFYYLFSHFNLKTCLVSVLHFLAMLEIGTKVALYGLLGSMILSLFVWLFHCLALRNETFSWKPLLTMAILFALFGVTYRVTPAVQRYNYEIYWAKSHDADISKENAELKTGLNKYKNDKEGLADFEKQFLAKNYQKYALNKRFITKSYPYQYDPQFWINMLSKPATYRLANRNVEEAMLDQVVKYNNNPLDKWMGIGYMRETHIFNLERDFTAQKYSLGIIGMILYLGFYVGIILYGVYEWLRYKGVRTYLISSMLMASVFILGASFMSGNVMDFPTANLLLGFLDGSLLLYIREGKRKTSNKKTFEQITRANGIIYGE